MCRIHKTCQAVVQKSPDKKAKLNRNPLKAVEEFGYLRDVVSTEGRAHDLLAFIIRAGWNKFKKLPLSNRVLKNLVETFRIK